MAEPAEPTDSAQSAPGSDVDATPAKLCIVVVPDVDGDRLIDALVELGLYSTKIGSTGGFLRRGSSTLLTAVPETELSKVVAMLHREFPVRTERIPARQLPVWEEHELAPETVEVRVGGAVMFVLDISRFMRS